MFVGIAELPVKPGSASLPSPGVEIAVLDAAGQQVPVKKKIAVLYLHPLIFSPPSLQNGTVGSLSIKLPLPPGYATTLWNNDAWFRDTYLAAFPGFYSTSDAGFVDDDGYVHVMARTDDVIVTAGHNLSSGSIEVCCVTFFFFFIHKKTSISSCRKLLLHINMLPSAQ